MKKRLTITYILCIHLILGFVLFKSDFIQRVESKILFGQYTKPKFTEHFNAMLDYHSRMDGNMPDGAVVFIGDSHIQGLCVSAIVPSSVNYGIGGDTTAGVLQRLPNYKSIGRASAVVIAIGINDMKFRSNEEILHNYSAIAGQIPENIPVIFSAVLPIDEEARDDWQGRNQDRIRSLNSELENLTREYENYFFVDGGALLTDAQGNLADEFHDGDGLHLNSKGNAIWIQQLQMIIAISQQSAVDDKE